MISKFLFALNLALSFLLLEQARAVDPEDYLIQKVCVDAQGNVLLADPYFPPAGSHLRNLRFGEPFPYYKHDQPTANHPNGFQRKDSYPVLDKDGREFAVNPFYFGESAPGNGYDVYCVRDGWASAPSTWDGGGFGTTFFGKVAGTYVAYNGWLFFPTSFVSGNFNPASGSAKVPFTLRYWEHDGEPWPGTPSTSILTFFLPHLSRTDWKLISNCSFGGMGGNPVKNLDAIMVVHGYHAPDDSNYQAFLQKGHLEIFYFTQLYGGVRWEVWEPIEKMGDYNKPSEVRAQALAVARHAGRPIPEAGESYIQPTDLPPTPENRFIVADFSGEPGAKSRFVVTSMRDWSAVTVLPSLQYPPPCPIPQQNLLTNFHFDGGNLTPWQCAGTSDASSWSLRQSHAPLDVKYVQNGSDGGVRYLALHCADASGPQIYQDIPVKDLRSGAYVATLKIRSEGAQGQVRLQLQQIGAAGKILSTDLTVAQLVGPTNEHFSYAGVNDQGANASVVLSSTMMSGRAQVTIRPGTEFLRFSVQPQSAGDFDLIDANVSIQSPPAS